MKSVLVTGASGFVGKQTLQPLLDRGFHVHAVSRSPQKPEIQGVIWHAADLLDHHTAVQLIQAVSPSHLLHAAWFAVPGQFWEAPENHQWLSASQTLIQAFQKHGGQRLVTLGSCAEYDWQGTENLPLPETRACNPHTLYGQSKLALFHSTWEFSLQQNLSYAHARLFFLFGPDEPPQKLIASLCQALKSQQAIACGPGFLTRDYTDTRDIGMMLAELLDSDLTGAVNVASGEPTSLEQIATILEQLSGQPSLIRLGERYTSAEPFSIVADCTKIRSIIKSALPSFEARLQEAFQAYCINS